jgi:hypothetical protein
MQASADPAESKWLPYPDFTCGVPRSQLPMSRISPRSTGHRGLIRAGLASARRLRASLRVTAAKAGQSVAAARLVGKPAIANMILSTI